ncbi:PepSY domain-containing protein [Actinoplanes subglobosus]|uniref:PepSY domain-containing protein n=1 Tax=Actinoplanes subglobosus TaxID=1547892 RepID=A0ABV8J110_9ACTN
MRRPLLIAVTVAGVVVPLAAGTALAMADDSSRSTGSGFEIEIDPELDAQFGPRPVNAVQAAAIVTRRFPGARVLEAELDERGGGPIWEVEFRLNGDEDKVDVDAVTGAILGGDDD